MNKNIFHTSHQTGNVVMIFAIILPVLLGLIALALNTNNNVGDYRAAQNALDVTNLNYLRTYVLEGDVSIAEKRGEASFDTNIAQEGWNLKLGSITRSNRHLIAVSTAVMDNKNLMHQKETNSSVKLEVISEVRVPIRSISAVLVTDVSASMGSRFKSLQQAMNIFGDRMYVLPKDFADELEISIVPYASSVNISDLPNNPGLLIEGKWSYKKRKGDNVKKHYKDIDHYESDTFSCNSNIKDHDAVTEYKSGSYSNINIQVKDEEWINEYKTVRTEWKDMDGDGVDEPHDIKDWVSSCRVVQTVRPWSGCLQTKKSDFVPPYDKPSVKRHHLPPVFSEPQKPSEIPMPRCPEKSATLQVEIPNYSKFSSFVNKMKKGYGTAHDVGMLWGLRVLDPSWASFFGVQKRQWNDEFAPKYLIFLSDGRSTSPPFKFGDYKYDQAIDVQNRTNKICTYLKDKGVTIYGISYEHPKEPDKIETVANCASPGQHYEADESDISQVFSNIAYQIKTEALRISK